jgi:hypothetical protein
VTAKKIPQKLVTAEPVVPVLIGMSRTAQAEAAVVVASTTREILKVELVPTADFTEPVVVADHKRHKLVAVVLKELLLSLTRLKKKNISQKKQKAPFGAFFITSNFLPIPES